MLFNSYEFIFVFLPISFFVYFYLNRLRLTRASKAFLVFASLFFYSWWNISYLPLILVSILFNYTIGTVLSDETKNKKISKKTLLTIGITINVILLAYFKYMDFFIENINIVLNSNILLLHLALPLAISFFTFQQIAYLVDSYRGETKEYDFLNYIVFVTFFPQLIAGPIVHHKEMMPQFDRLKNNLINYKNIALGIFIFTIGLFKKVVIADTFAIWASSGFDNAHDLTLIASWISSLAYTIQLYFDFSGYTDMAIGVGLLFNIKLPTNFDSPYKAVSIQDFWRRWHITLSRFLRDYIYIPLGGNRVGEFKVYGNLMITFIIGGLWHGAGWTFVLWGFLHGLALVIYRIWHKLGFKLNSFIGWFITFNFINITWVVFRAENVSTAWIIIKSMFGLNGIFMPNALHPLFDSLGLSNIEYGSFVTILKLINGDLMTPLWFIVILPILFLVKNSNEMLSSFKPRKLTALFFAIIFSISVLKLSGYSEFLYFRF